METGLNLSGGGGEETLKVFIYFTPQGFLLQTKPYGNGPGRVVRTLPSGIPSKNMHRLLGIMADNQPPLNSVVCMI